MVAAGPGDDAGRVHVVAEEEPLSGGNVGTGIVRVGDTVRRPCGPWSASVDALLLHLERAGYPAAPHALGYDEQGRQVLSFIDGYVDARPVDLGPGRLRLIGSLIRDFHDAVESFVPPPNAVWNVAIRPDGDDIICHNDLAPWNLIRNGHLVFIDWDGAGPGTLLWDLAYAIHGFVPLSAAADLEDSLLQTRVSALVSGYRLDATGRRHLLALLVPRIRSMHDLLAEGHRCGRQPWARLWSEGHGVAWVADADYTQRRYQALQAVLDR